MFSPTSFWAKRSTLCVLALINAKTLRKAEESVAFATLVGPALKSKRQRRMNLYPSLLVERSQHSCSSLTTQIPALGRPRSLACKTNSPPRVFTGVSRLQQCSSSNSVCNLEISFQRDPDPHSTELRHRSLVRPGQKPFVRDMPSARGVQPRPKP